MMRIAHERGIDITAGIWDHIYRGGVQAGGIPGAAGGRGQAHTGIRLSASRPTICRAIPKPQCAKFLAVFPEVDAIQFRMHDESGLKRDEMSGFWHEVFSFIKAERPNMRIDLRAKDLPDAVINDAVDQGLKARVNTKYWMEQLGLPFHPTHVNPTNQHDRRAGYADLLHFPQNYSMQWQVWTAGTTRLLLWGDPEYVRRLAASARLYGSSSFEINEMLATRMLGEPSDEAPLPILNARYKYYDYEFERYWDFYRVWGRLTATIRKPPPKSGKANLRIASGAAAGVHVMKALESASQGAAAYRSSGLSLRLLPHHPRLGRNEPPGLPAEVRHRRKQRRPAVRERPRRSAQHAAIHRHSDAPPAGDQPLVHANRRRHRLRTRPRRKGDRPQGWERIHFDRHRPQNSRRPGTLLRRPPPRGGRLQHV